MHPLKTKRDTRNLKWKWKYVVRNMPKKRLPAIAVRAVRESRTYGRIKEKTRRDTVRRKVWGLPNKSKREDRNKGNASGTKQGEAGGTLRDLRGVKRRCRHENVFARPDGFAKR